MRAYYRPRAAGGAGRLLATALAAVMSVAALPVHAAAAPAGETVTEELIRLLAERLLLSKEEAERLLGRLQAEKAAAPAALPPGQSVAQSTPASPGGRVRVIYLTDSERAKIRGELREEVLATAEKENWSLPGIVPEWVRRVHIDGDVRVRQEFDLLDGANSQQFINFQAINAGAPVNTNPPVGQPLALPVQNATEDRQQTRVRARIGLGAEITPALSAGIRLSSGNTANPVSANQTLGNDLNKLSLVIDRVWMNYRFGTSTELRAGRIASPWVSTELVWDEDLGFDGFAASYRHAWGGDLEQRTTVGAFATGNTDFNYPSNSLAKEGSRDKWVFGAQTVFDWKLQEDLALRAALGYYDFRQAEGRLSEPCYAPTTAVPCSSDNSRPGFMQKGNTLFALRDLVVLAPTDPNYQYFGLASEFRVLDLNTRIDKHLGEGIHLVLDADLAWNLAFDESELKARIPVNNYGSCPAATPACTPDWKGGDLAFLVQALWGYPTIVERGQWNAFAGYRRIESDAVVDAFTDSDFHLGGTNAKGYVIGGNYGIARNAWVGARWLSASEIDGAPYAIDVLQLDLNARF